MTPPASHLAKISVIICTRNRHTDILELIENLLGQTLMPNELVVIDASDDDSLADKLNHLHPAIETRYVHTQPGVTRQRNIGLAQSSGDILVFLDDDVLIESDFIARLCQVFERDIAGRIGAVMGRIRSSDDWLTNLPIRVRINHALRQWVASVFLLNKPGNGRFRYSGFPTHPQNMDTSGFIECLSIGCSAFRREVFGRIRFDEALARYGYSYMDDTDISKQLMDAGYLAYYESSASLVHKKSPGGRPSPWELHHMQVLHHSYIFKKNWPQTPLRLLAFWWSIIGFVVLDLTHPVELKGTLAGVRAILRDRNALLQLADPTTSAG